MGDGHIRSEVDQTVATLTIDRPQRSNALTPALCDELQQAVASAAADPEVRALVLRGAGGRAFCGGFDLDHVEPDVDDAPLRRLMATVRQAPVPVVAVLDGAAVGAGFELASSCDLRVGAHGVKVGVPAVRLGVAYDLDGIARMIRASAGAAHLLLTGSLVAIDDLPGFATVVAAADLDTTVAELNGRLGEASPAALHYTRRALAWSRGEGPDDRADLERLRRAVQAGPDLQEAGEARRAGRAPRFRRG